MGDCLKDWRLMRLRCKKCKADLMAGWAYCPHCGRKIT